MWQPIETAPKDGKFLVFGGEWRGEFSNSLKNYMTLVEYDCGQFIECGGDYYSSWIENPTHWMPLPEPPIV